MHIQSDTIALAVPAHIVSLKGRGKAQREAAYSQIAPLSFVESLSRADTIANLRAALGSSPSDKETQIARTEWIIGRVASRIPTSERPKDCTDDNALLMFARELVMQRAAPVQDGKKANKLRAGQTGRRTAVQHKIVRAAEEAWSLVKAELGLGTAQTLKERNKAKRSTNANPVRGAGKAATPPTHSELVKPERATTAEEASNYVQSQAATLLAYANKNAKTLRAGFGSAILRFSAEIRKEAEAEALAKAEADAKAAEKMK